MYWPLRPESRYEVLIIKKVLKAHASRQIPGAIRLCLCLNSQMGHTE